MTLTDFLLARIAEDEAVARSVVKANEGGSRTQDEPWGLSWQDDNDQMSIEPDRILCVEPARVLAECEAKRRIVALHEIDADPKKLLAPGPARVVIDGPVEYACLVCDRPEIGHQGYHPEEGCLTLLLLALPYADHPDYDPAWRP